MYDSPSPPPASVWPCAVAIICTPRCEIVRAAPAFESGFAVRSVRSRSFARVYDVIFIRSTFSKKKHFCSTFKKKKKGASLWYRMWCFHTVRGDVGGERRR